MRNRHQKTSGCQNKKLAKPADSNIMTPTAETSSLAGTTKHFFQVGCPYLGKNQATNKFNDGVLAPESKVILEETNRSSTQGWSGKAVAVGELVNKRFHNVTKSTWTIKNTQLTPNPVGRRKWEWLCSLAKQGGGRLQLGGTATPIKAALHGRKSHSGSSKSASNNYHWCLKMDGAKPLYSRRGVADPNGRKAGDSRTLMDDPAAQLFDELKTVYNMCRIRPFHFERTAKQKQLTTLVTTKKGWNCVKGEFEKQVRKDGLMSFDVENFLPDHATLKAKKKAGKTIEWYEEERLKYVLLGSLRGRVIILDMDALHEAYRACGEEDQSTSIPKEVLQWLKDGSILIAGSDITGDCRSE